MSVEAIRAQRIMALWSLLDSAHGVAGRSRMTKKDYEAMATILIEALEHATKDDVYTSPALFAHHVLSSMVDDMCDMFAADNPNFDPDRFRKAVYD
jgi:hypothetical protein